jgi:polyribonucleotide nucleotidyltransferase
VENVEDVLNRGDEVSVRVVEVDRERGRIGLRLAQDPDIAGKSVEELAGVAAAGAGAGRGPRAGDGERRGSNRRSAGNGRAGNNREGRAPRRDEGGGAQSGGPAAGGLSRGSGRPRHNRERY